MNLFNTPSQIPSREQEIARVSADLNHDFQSNLTADDLSIITLESFIKSTIPVDKKFSDKQPPLTRDQWRELGYDSDGWFGTEELAVLNKLAELIKKNPSNAETILKSYRNAEMRYENEKQSLTERTKKSLRWLRDALTEDIFDEINPLDAACIIQLNVDGWKDYGSIPEKTWFLAGYRPNISVFGQIIGGGIGNRELKALNLMFQRYKTDANFKKIVDEYVNANADKALQYKVADVILTTPTAQSEPATQVVSTSLNAPDAAGSAIKISSSTVPLTPALEQVISLSGSPSDSSFVSTPAQQSTTPTGSPDALKTSPYQSEVSAIVASATSADMITKFNALNTGKTPEQQKEIMDEIFRQLKQNYIRKGKEYIDNGGKLDANYIKTLQVSNLPVFTFITTLDFSLVRTTPMFESVLADLEKYRQQKQMTDLATAIANETDPVKKVALSKQLADLQTSNKTPEAKTIAISPEKQAEMKQNLKKMFDGMKKSFEKNDFMKGLIEFFASMFGINLGENEAPKERKIGDVIKSMEKNDYPQFSADRNKIFRDESVEKSPEGQRYVGDIQDILIHEKSLTKFEASEKDDKGSLVYEPKTFAATKNLQNQLINDGYLKSEDSVSGRFDDNVLVAYKNWISGGRKKNNTKLTSDSSDNDGDYQGEQNSVVKTNDVSSRKRTNIKSSISWQKIGGVSESTARVEQRVLLTGKDIQRMSQSMELSPDQKEIVGQFEKLAIFTEVVNLWTEQADRVAEGMIGQRFRNAPDDLRKATEVVRGEMDLLMKNLSSYMISGVADEKVKQAMNIIKDTISSAENQTSVIGKDDMIAVFAILDGNKNKDEKLVSIYDQMRYQGLSGNSIGVRRSLENQLLTRGKEQKDNPFQSVETLLADNSVVEAIKSEDVAHLKTKGIDEKLAKELCKAYVKTNAQLNKRRSELTKMLAVQNKDLPEGQKVKIDDFIKLSAENTTLELLKKGMILSVVDTMPNRAKDPFVKLYASTVGLGETSGSDWYKIADENIDTAIDVGVTLALASVSMGVGALAARGAMAVATGGYRLARGAVLADRLAAGGKLARGTLWTARFAAPATVQGFAFYEGTNLMNNTLFSKWSVWENAGNGKEILKSIAFMKVLEVYGQFAPKLFGKEAVGWEYTMPLRQIPGKDWVKIGASLLTEAGLVVGTSHGTEMIASVFGDNVDFESLTIGEYLQAIALVALMKGSGKVTIENAKKVLSNVKKWPATMEELQAQKCDLETELDKAIRQIPEFMTVKTLQAKKVDLEIKIAKAWEKDPSNLTGIKALQDEKADLEIKIAKAINEQPSESKAIKALRAKIAKVDGFIKVKSAPAEEVKSDKEGAKEPVKSKDKTEKTTAVAVEVKWSDLSKLKNIQDKIMTTEGKPFTGKISESDPLVQSDGSKISGEMVDGKLNGKGKLSVYNPDGSLNSEAEGIFKDDELQKGIITYADGKIIEVSNSKSESVAWVNTKAR